jgi:ADP-ribosyl-[dinitrogen reductase] hydrolase
LVVQCGGDANTTAAILGGIIGDTSGKAGIPQAWKDNLVVRPSGLSWIESAGSTAASADEEGRVLTPIVLHIPGKLLRNIIFLRVVSPHGFCRLFQPG